MSEEVRIDLGATEPRDPLANSKPGDELVWDGTSYFYLRRGLENRVLAISSHGAPLEMPDPATGFPMPPTTRTIVAAMRAHRFFLRSDPLDDPVRAEARAEEPTTSDVWHRNGEGILDRCDKGAVLRNLVTRHWDAACAEDRPMLGDKPLRAWVESHPAMRDAVVAFGRVPAGSTLREWIRRRGREGDRRAADMPSRTGKVRRRRRFHDLVVRLGKLHALSHATSRRPTKVEWTRFKRSVAKASKGEEIRINGAVVGYERPSSPLKPYGLTTFRLECRRARSHVTDAARLGAEARRKLHGGGGAAQEPVRFLDIVQQDDTPFPNWFLVDPVRRMPIGPATVVGTMDLFTRVFVGWDFSLEAPSTSTWLRALAHCGVPKPIPEHLAEDFPEVGDLYGHIAGRVVYDNALQNVGHAAQDAAGDLAHAITIAGEGEATHKAVVERHLKTIQGYMKVVDGYTFDVALMRKFGYDPAKHVVVTIDEFRRMLDAAFQTYHTQPHDALDQRSPLQVWREQTAIHGHREAKDVDQFLRSIGDTHLVTFDRTGFEVNGLRYTLGTEGNEQLMADFASETGTDLGTGPMAFEAKAKSYDLVGSASILNPKTRRYVDVPCALRRYSADLPLWLHRRIVEWVAMTRREFRTEEQMEDAREAFTAALEEAVPEASARQQRLFAGVLDAPNVRRHLGSDVVVRRVAASATGMAAEVVPHDGRVATRKDAMQRTARPQRGGANLARAEAFAKAEQKAVADLAAREVGKRPKPRRAPRGATSTKATGEKRSVPTARTTPNAKPKGTGRAAVKPLRPAPFA